MILRTKGVVTEASPMAKAKEERREAPAATEAPAA